MTSVGIRTIIAGSPSSGCRSSSIRLAPPLIVKRAELDIGLDILKDCLEELT